MRIVQAAAIAWFAFAFAGSAGAQSIECRGGLKPQQVAEVLFGRKIGDHGVVSEGAWRRFVAKEITSRFPDGLTIVAANGQWRDPASKRVIREPSNLVLIVLPGNAEDQDRLKEVAEAYKQQFRQKSVLIVVRAACVTFSD